MGEAGSVLLGLCFSGSVFIGLLREILPLAPTVKVDERLHATPLHHLAFEPYEVHRLSKY